MSLLHVLYSYVQIYINYIYNIIISNISNICRFIFLQSKSSAFNLIAPTWFGFILHLIVFFLLVRLIIMIKLPGTKD
jgi:hypothetical protein